MIVICSTREGRQGIKVADWFVGKAKAHGGFSIDVADLKEIALPMLDELAKWDSALRTLRTS